MCQECHTPRDVSGALDFQQWLKGGAVFLQPAVPVSDWASRVPALLYQDPQPPLGQDRPPRAPSPDPVCLGLRSFLTDMKD
jgi:hypothetical protein